MGYNSPMEKIAFFDVDRTIRNGSAALDFCNYLAKRGLVNESFRPEDSAVREAYQAGKIDYQGMVEGVVKIHGAVLAGLRVGQLADEYESYVRETLAFFDWTQELFKLLHDYKFRTVLVSAGIKPAIEAIGKYLGASHIITSEPEVRDGVYTGRVLRILHDTDKYKLVGAYISQLGPESFKLGFGDSTGDVSMFELMDQAIIFSPHQEEMYQIAQTHGWHIVNNREAMFSAINHYL
jgi:HAD superfamily phosphoserine phosphatase-like hydrolase